MPTQKIIRSLFAEILQEAEKSSSFSGQLGAVTIKQLSKLLLNEMKTNQSFADRLAEIVLPDVMPNPVSIVQKEGALELARRLKRLNVTDMRTVAMKNGLASQDYLKGKKRPELIKLIVDRSEEEAKHLKGI